MKTGRIDGGKPGQVDTTKFAEGLDRAVKLLKKFFGKRPERRHFLKPDWRSRQDRLNAAKFGYNGPPPVGLVKAEPPPAPPMRRG